MQMPVALRSALDEAVKGIPWSSLEREAAAMSEAYRAGRPPKLDTELARAAYAVVRLPATYAAVRAALRELPPAGIETANDLGSGFGAGAWALAETLGSVSTTLVERNAGLLEWSRRLATPGVALRQELQAAIPAADVQLFSYSLGELTEATQATVLARVWASAGRALVIVEPGTTVGFGVIRRARALLLEAGARLVAPCPHSLECPMLANDWCHFAARVERSALHRRLKGGSLSYEDEKFSYVVFTRDDVGRAEGRVIRHPQIAPGLIQMPVCAASGVVEKVAVKQRDKERWRVARKTEWGDRWPSIR